MGRSRWRPTPKAEERVTLGEDLYTRGVRWLIARREAADAGRGAAAEVDRRLRGQARELSAVQMGLFVLGLGERLAFRAWVGGGWQRWYSSNGYNGYGNPDWRGKWLPDCLVSKRGEGPRRTPGPAWRRGTGPCDREAWS